MGVYCYIDREAVWERCIRGGVSGCLAAVPGTFVTGVEELCLPPEGPGAVSADPGRGSPATVHELVSVADR